MNNLFPISAVRRLIKLLALLSAGFICFVGITETTPEPGSQELWFIYSVFASFPVAIIIFLGNARKIKLSFIDIIVFILFLWYLFCYYANESIVILETLELFFLALAYIFFRILFASYRNAGKWLFVIICICGVIEATTGIIQALGIRVSHNYSYNITGTFFNPGPYGGYIAVIFALALGYVSMRFKYYSEIFAAFKNRKNRSPRNILWLLVYAVAVITSVLAIIVLPSTMSRAAFVAVIVAIAAMITSNRKIYSVAIDYIRRDKRRAIITAIFLLALIFGSGYGIYEAKKDSADGRLLMWKISGKVILENPLSGVGPGYFRGAYGDVQAEFFRTEKRPNTQINIAGSPEYGFNDYLQIGVETGIVGLLLFLTLVVAVLWRLFRVKSYYAFGLVALLVFAFFSYPLNILPFKIVLILFIAYAGAQYARRRKVNTGEIILTGTVLAGNMIAAILLFNTSVNRVRAVEEWQGYRRWYTMGYHSYIPEDYPKIFAVMKENPVFLFEYGHSLNITGRYRESLDILVPATRRSNDPMLYNVIGNNHKELGEYENAAEAYLKAYYMVPHRIYPIYLLAKMYFEMGERKQSMFYARWATEKIPKVESPATREMQQEMYKIIRILTTE